MSLKLKISLFFSGLLLAAIGMLTAVLIWSESKTLLENELKQQQKLAGGLAEVTAGALFSKQELPLLTYLKRLETMPEIIAAGSADLEARYMAHTNAKLIGSNSPDPDFIDFIKALHNRSLPHTVSGTEELKVFLPVKKNDVVVAAVDIIFKKQVIAERLAKNLAAARNRIFQFSVPVILIGFACTFLLTGYLIKPLKALVHGARSIGKGNLDHSIPVKNNDEIGFLSREFNHMAVKLKELDQMKQDFVSSITHDLKSPLTAIIASAELSKKETRLMAENKANPDILTENLELIQQKSERLKNLITSILEVAHIESGVVLNKKNVAIDDIVERVIQNFQQTADQKGIGLDMVMESDFPLFSLDESKIERALNNLVGNSVKFTSQGKVIVKLVRMDNKVNIHIIDTGPGIPPDFMKKLFTKFTRSTSKQTAGIEGTGLGLTITKGIIEAHGWQIHVKSEMGQGAEFIVSIPLGSTGSA